jgi:hypothetical protein
MSGPATLGDLRSFVQANARRIGRGFTRPDDDWIMVCFVQSPRGVEVMPLEMPLDGFGKTALGEALRQANADYGVYRYAVLLNAHGVEDISEQDLARVRHEEVRVGDMPGAFEQLVLIVGDAEQEEVWRARIERDGRRPPRLGPWERPTFDAATGRFAGLNAYMREPR